jgi:hypothetical protein
VKLCVLASGGGWIRDIQPEGLLCVSQVAELGRAWAGRSVLWEGAWMHWGALECVWSKRDAGGESLAATQDSS